MVVETKYTQGTRDFGPVRDGEMQLHLQHTIKEVYAFYGFQIETPAMETLPDFDDKVW